MTKFILVFTVLLCTGSAFAEAPFETYFGSFKITGCRYTLNEQPVRNDPECNYSHLQVGKDSQGVVRITRITNAGSSIGEPVEVFNRQQGKFTESATFSTYGKYQVWQHTFSRPDGELNQSIEIMDFVFNTDQNQKLTFSVSMTLQNHRGNSSSLRVFDMVRE